jgi:DNA-directed RNA polymerase II subunit RPB1
MLSKDKKLSPGIARNKWLKTYAAMTVGKKRKDKSIDKDVKYNMPCPKCRSPHPHIKLTKPRDSKINTKVVVRQTFYNSSGSETFKQLFANEILEAVSKIPDSLVEMMGEKISSHPRHMVRRIMSVPPNTIRPQDNRSDSRSGIHDLTYQIQQNFNMDRDLPAIIPSVIEPKLQAKYNSLSNGIHNLHCGKEDKTNSDKSGPVMNGIKGILSGKKARFRGDLMGSNVHHVHRSVIAGDSRLRLHEVAISVHDAIRLYMEIPITTSNIEENMILFKNGVDTYPGCLAVWKSSSREWYDIGLIGADVILEAGDMLRRNILNGDTALFNRQPSLWPLSIRSVTIVVQFGTYAIHFNPAICMYFNADFDGDEMVMYIMVSTTAARESELLCSIKNTATNMGDGNPMAGMVQNTLMATSTMTRSNVIMSREVAMTIVGNVPDEMIELDPKQNTFTGRELFSSVLPKCVNLTKRPSVYDPNYPIKYKEDEILTIIKDGKMISGIADKAIVGEGVRGNVFHQIAQKLGAAKANAVVYAMGQLGDGFLETMGSTVHLKDFLIPQHAREEVAKITQTTLMESREFHKQYRRGKVNPANMTPQIHHEIQQQEILRGGGNYDKTILANITQDNNLFKMVFGCGKGNKAHMIAMMSAVGQSMIDGARISWNLSRSSPYHVRYSDDPHAHGYISSSFVDGLDIVEAVSSSRETRRGLTNRQLATAGTGAVNREAVKNMETLVVDPYRRLVSGDRITQSLYGVAGIDVQSIIHTRLDYITMSTAAFEKKYKGTSKDEFDAIAADRINIRQSYLRMEFHYISSHLMEGKIHVPLNLDFIIEEAIVSSGGGGIVDEVKSAAAVKKFNIELPYIFFNRYRLADKSPISKLYEIATLPMQMLIRSKLCGNELKRLSISHDLLKLILERVYVSYSAALVAPGTMAGLYAALVLIRSYTQFMLDSHLRSNVGSTNTVGKWDGLDVLMRPNKERKNARMRLHLKRNDDEAHAIKLANHITTMNLSHFIKDDGLVFGGEEYGNPKHPILKSQIAVIEKVRKFGIGGDPTDLSSWVVHFNIDINKLYGYNMTMATIMSTLGKFKDDAHIIRSSEISEDLFITMYIRDSVFKESGGSIEAVDVFTKTVLGATIRGVPGITSAFVSKFEHSYIEDNGSMGQRSTYTIETVGSNLLGVLTIPAIDPTRSQSNSIKEMEDVFGVDIGRAKLISEMRTSFEGHSFVHYSVFGAEMSHTGTITGISASGAISRGADVLTIASYREPLTNMTKGALAARTTKINNISSALVTGAPMRGVGTLACDLCIDEESLAASRQNLSDLM